MQQPRSPQALRHEREHGRAQDAERAGTIPRRAEFELWSTGENAVSKGKLSQVEAPNEGERKACFSLRGGKSRPGVRGVPMAAV